MLRYVKYNLLRTHPYLATMAFITLLLLCTSHFNSNSQTDSIFCVTTVICIIMLPIKKAVWSNDYLVAVKYPFFKSFYLYQRVKKKRLKQMTCKEIYNDYFSELKAVLDNLPTGKYITITQPMFTRAIRNSTNIRVIIIEKAYQKKIKVLHGSIFLNQCKKCACANCPAYISDTYKQFYYIEFSV